MEPLLTPLDELRLEGLNIPDRALHGDEDDRHGIWSPFVIPRLVDKPQNPIIARLELAKDNGREKCADYRRYSGLTRMGEEGEKVEELKPLDPLEVECKGDVWLEAVGRYVDYKVRFVQFFYCLSNF